MLLTSDTNGHSDVPILLVMFAVAMLVTPRLTVTSASGYSVTLVVFSMVGAVGDPAAVPVLT